MNSFVETCPTLGHRQRGRWLGIILLLLGSLLVFAHGCHGDEDNELFEAVSTIE